MVDERPRILCVDDDAGVLDGLGRTLRRHFRVETCPDPTAGLQKVAGPHPFAVVLSDMRMPVMDGAEFLSCVRQVSPDTVRVLLTGYADVEAAIDAVNRGNIFRFLTKPCPPEDLIAALTQAAEQYRLITAEHVLLEQTLRGSVEALSNILALVHPSAFGRAVRAQGRVRELLDHFRISERWAAEVAAMLSQIGCVVLPPHTADALYRGEALSDPEQQMVRRMPQVTEDLLAHIPRLEPVRAVLRVSQQHYRELHSRSDVAPSDRWGGCALRIVLDYDELECRLVSLIEALQLMRGRRGWYDPEIFEAFAALQGSRDQGEIREVLVSELRLGMALADDVKTLRGLLLIARGQRVTSSLLERIKNFSSTVGIKEPIRIAPVA